MEQKHKNHWITDPETTDSKSKSTPVKIYKLAFVSLFLCFSRDHFSSERKTCSLILLGKIEEDIAINPPTKKRIPESRSRILGKKSSFTNVTTLTLRNSDKKSSSERLIAKKARLTFKAQAIDRCQFQGISITRNLSNDLFISLLCTRTIS